MMKEKKFIHSSKMVRGIKWMKLNLTLIHMMNNKHLQGFNKSQIMILIAHWKKKDPMIMMPMKNLQYLLSMTKIKIHKGIKDRKVKAIQLKQNNKFSIDLI
jgi:hypothetical protein